MGLLALPQCALFSGTPRTSGGFAGPLAADTAAWVLARACRLEFLGVDPRPGCAHVPVLRHAAGSYGIRYVRDPDRVFRVYCNGRLTRPRADGLNGCRFLPQVEATGQSAAATADEVRIAIDAEGTGCRVQVDLLGAPATAGLEARLRCSFAAACAVAEAGRLLERGEPDAADRIACAALDAIQRDWQPGIAFFAARLHMSRGLVARAHEDLPAMRRRLMLALSHDPHLAKARTLLAGTLERLADRAGMAAHTAHATDRSRLWAGSALDRARNHLAAGDHAAAANWARRALLDGEDPAAAHRLLATTFAATDHPQRALEEALVALDCAGFQPDLVLEIARLHGRLGNPTAGVRLLDRYQHRLAATDLHATLPGLVAQMPRHLAARVLSGPVAARFRDLLDGGLGPACAQVHARRDARAAAPGTPLIDDGYRSASGVEAAPTR